MIVKKDHLKQNLHIIIFQQSECQFHNTVKNNRFQAYPCNTLSCLTSLTCWNFSNNV